MFGAQLDLLSEASGLARAIAEHPKAVRAIEGDALTHRLGDFGEIDSPSIPSYGVIRASGVEVTYFDRGRILPSSGDMLTYKFRGIEISSGEEVDVEIREIFLDDTNTRGEILTAGGWALTEDTHLVEKIRYSVALNLADEI